MKKIALLIVVAALSFPTFAGGPWLYKKGSGFLQFQAIPQVIAYDRIFLGTRSDWLDINRPVYGLDLGVYGEYGLTDRLNIMAHLPFKYVATGDQAETLHNPNLLDQGSLVGLSNVGLALKYGLLDKGFKLAISAQARFNTASKELDKGLATGFLSNSFGVYLHAGGSWGKRWYTFVEAGVNAATNDYSNFIQGHVEVGYQISQRLSAALTLDIRNSLQDGSFMNENLQQTALFENDQEWIGSGVKFTYDTGKGWGYNFGTALVPLKVDGIGFAGTLTAGVYKTF